MLMVVPYYRRCRILFCLLLTGIALSALHAQPFTCDGSFYLVNFSTGGSVLQRISYDAYTLKEEVETIPLSEPRRRITCLGFNINDLYLYALDFDTRELLRIDSKGLITVLGIPQGLNPNYDYYAGEVTSNGRSLMVIGRDRASGTDKVVYTIGLRQAPYGAGSIAVNPSGGPVAISDIATDPIRGVTYGFDGLNRRLTVISNGLSTSYSFANIPQTITALFFDRDGTLYGYGSTSSDITQSVLYRIDKTTGRTAALTNGLQGRESDGCSCPFTFTFERQIYPDTILPCTEVEIRYTIINRTGASWLGFYFIDSLPPPLVITEIVQKTSTLSTVGGGPGANWLELKNFDVQLDTNLIVLKGYVGKVPPGSYLSQAYVKGLPFGLGIDRFSDNPGTPEPNDPNRLVILPPASYNLDVDVRYSCDRDTAYVSVPLTAETYLWSDGSRQPTLAVTKNGRYWVEVNTTCHTFRDTFDIGSRPPQFKVELGPERKAELGERLELSFEANEKGPFSLSWSADPALEMSCAYCSNPAFTALQDVLIRLEARNVFGCQSTDSVRVRVAAAREVYFPNAFSPDGNGVNDVFFPQGKEGSSLEWFRIFDRWGNLLLEIRNGQLNDPKSGWDGRTGSKPAQEGVYLYDAAVRFADGVLKQFTGEVGVLRGIRE